MDIKIQIYGDYQTVENCDESETVFELTEKGYFLMPGDNFGSDFIAYEVNPNQSRSSNENHSKYLVFCIDGPIQKSDFIGMNRIAQSVGKKALFSWKDKNPILQTVEVSICKE